MRRFLTVLVSVLALLVVAVPAAGAATLTFSVNTTTDETTPADSFCSLREAISAADAGAGTADCPGTPSASTVVNVPAGHYTLAIASSGADDNSTGDLNLTNTTNNVTLQGASARTTIIDANGIDRVLHVAPSATATVDNVTITGGRLPASNAVVPDGGGIYNEGTLAVSNSAIVANHSADGADNSCGNCSAQSAGAGAGIANLGHMDFMTFTQTGSLLLTSSTVSGNVTGNGGNEPVGYAGSGGSGAGIESLVPLTVTNSTITNNTTGNGGTQMTGGSYGGNGAGLLIAGVATIVNSTIADNHLGTGANGNGQYGGVDLENFSVTLRNTLLAANAGANCHGAITDNGGNLSFPATDTSCPVAFLSGDPALGPLADNGGPTDTRALGAGSAAADQVAAATCPATDQRGVARPQPAGGACDIGAFERATPPPAATPSPPVNTGAPAITGTPAVGATLACSTGAWSGATPQTYGYQWLRDGAGLAGATGSSYNVLASDAGHSLACRVTATNVDGSATADSAGLAIPAAVVVLPDTTAPVISAASFTRRVFAVDVLGPPEVGVAAAARTRPKKGTVIRYRLSENARVVVTLARVATGRRVGTRCGRPTKANRRHRACRRYLPVGRFAMTGLAGSNQHRFRGRIGRKILRPGRYRASLVAADPAGNHSKVKRLPFSVVHA